MPSADTTTAARSSLSLFANLVIVAYASKMVLQHRKVAVSASGLSGCGECLTVVTSEVIVSFVSLLVHILSDLSLEELYNPTSDTMLVAQCNIHHRLELTEGRSWNSIRTKQMTQGVEYLWPTHKFALAQKVGGSTTKGVI